MKKLFLISFFILFPFLSKSASACTILQADRITPMGFVMNNVLINMSNTKELGVIVNDVIVNTTNTKVLFLINGNTIFHWGTSTIAGYFESNCGRQ